MKEHKLELTLLFDYYGDLLTEKQRTCFDLYYNQDMSLSEIAQEAGISRQGVHDSLTRARVTMQNLEATTGAMERDRRCREALVRIRAAAEPLCQNANPKVVRLAREILAAADTLEG